MSESFRVCDLIEWLNAISGKKEIPDTCDTLKIGDPQQFAKKIAVAMFATPAVIKAAWKWGADMMIVHEPLYYNHLDVHSDEVVEKTKRQLLKQTGMAVYRYHDYAHAAKPDLIAFSELKKIGLDGTVEYTDVFDLVRVTLEDGITARELAKRIEKKLGIKYVRIAGCADYPMKKISCMFGAPGGLLHELKREACEILIAGEVCEWSICEYARDASQMGFRKSVLALGHIGSERDGMMYLSEQIKETFPSLDVKYFECGEVYSYVAEE